MRFAIATLIALAAVPALSLAQMPTKAPGSRNPALVTAGTYQADPSHTLVTWTVDHMGFTPYTGIFGDITGTLTIDPKNLAAAKVDMTIPVSKTGHRQRGADPAPDARGEGWRQARFLRSRCHRALRIDEGRRHGPDREDHRRPDAERRDQAGHP